MQLLFKFFGYCRSKLWLLGVVLLIIIALGVSALRASLPYINQYRTQISQYLSDNYQLQLSLDHVAGRWDNGGPELTIKGLKFDNMTSLGVTFNAQQLRVNLDFRASLIALAPRFRLIEIKNSQLTLGQMPQGESESNDPIPYLFNFATKVEFQHATLEFEPSVYGAVPTFELATLQWINSPTRHQLQLSLLPSQVEGAESLSVVVDMYGDNSTNFGGQFYVKADDWQWLNLARPMMATLNPTANANINFELWGDFSHRGLSSAVLALAGNDITWSVDGNPQSISVAPTNIQWLPNAQGWQLVGQRLKVRVTEHRWPELSFLVNQAQGQLNATVDHLPLAGVLPLRGLFTSLPDKTNQLLNELNPQASLTDLSLWQQGESWHYQATVNGYTQQQTGLLPQIALLDALVSGNESSGQVRVTMAEQALDFGKLFAKPVKLKQLSSNLEWRIDGQRWWLFDKETSIATADINTQLSWQLAFEGDSSPILSLAGNAQLLAAKNIWRYLPHGALSEGLIKYLSASIKGGNSNDINILWQGALAKFPYRDNSGIFTVDATLKQAEFVFDSNWPQLSDATLKLQFKNEGLLITGLEGRVKQLKFSKLTAQIADLTKDPILEVNLTVTDTIGPIKRVVASSPLNKTVGSALKQLSIGGKVTADINIVIPFDGSEPLTKGQLTLKNNWINIVAIDVPLQRVKGTLNFVNGKIVGHKLTAVMYQQPLKFDILTKPVGEDYQIAINLAAKWQSTKIPSAWSAYVDDYIAGTLDWRAQIDLNLTADDVLYKVAVTSPMTGLSLKLPQPLSKYVDQKQALKVKVVGNTQGGEFKLALGSRAEVLAKFKVAAKQLDITTMALLVGKNVKADGAMVANQLGLEVDVPHLNIDQWNRFISNLEQGQQSSGFFPLLGHINIRVKQLSWFGQTLSNVLLKGTKQQGFWQISVSSEQAKGLVKLYDDLANTGIVADFEYFKLVTSGKTNGKTSDGTSEIATAMTKAQLLALPKLSFSCQQCRLDDYNLGKLSFNTGRNGQGITIENLSLEALSTSLLLSGVWGVDKLGEFTTLSGTLNSDNVVDTLKLLNFSSSIKDSNATVAFNLGWRGSIYAPAIGSLEGKVDWQLGEGHIAEVSDQGARIFSLFSLDSLRRKLVLDFRDVFVKGLFFNDFKGIFEIKKGIAVTHDTHMDGIAGDLEVIGSINLANKNLDYYLSFTPHLFSNIPVVAGVVTSAPQVFIVAFALTKVLAPIVDVVSQVNFKLTGTIAKPEFVEVNRKQKKYKVPKHMLSKQQVVTPLVKTGDSE